MAGRGEEERRRKREGVVTYELSTVRRELMVQKLDVPCLTPKFLNKFPREREKARGSRCQYFDPARENAAIESGTRLTRKEGHMKAKSTIMAMDEVMNR